MRLLLQEKNVEKELKALIKDRDEKREEAKGQTSLRTTFSGLLKPTGYKPLIIMIILFTFQQYTGVYITTFYAVQFFKVKFRLTRLIIIKFYHRDVKINKIFDFRMQEHQ